MAKTLVVPRTRRDGVHSECAQHSGFDTVSAGVNHKCEGYGPTSDPISGQGYPIWFGGPCNDGKIPLMRAHPGLVPNSIKTRRQDFGYMKCRLGTIQLLVSNC